MKALLISIIVLGSIFLVCNPSYSQYNTKFEEEVFKLYKENSPSAYELLNAINYNEELYAKGKRQIDEHIKNLRSKNLHLKPLKKQIQTIYKTTHSKFFKKYNEKSFFNNIFENGNYNCVTASAFYALMFDEFNINYSIKETPTHIYIIADTSGLQTLIESTLPGTGVVNYNEKFKNDFVAYLNKNKIISDIEFENSTTDEFFREYYSKDKSINLMELAAIQYYNKGIFLMMDEKFSGAASYLRKALAIYPSNSIRYNHYTALQNALINDYNKKIYDGKLFGQLVQLSIEDSSLIQLMSNYFNNVSLELCINSPDMDRFKNFYQDILSQCSVENIPSEILHKYHYFKAYNYGVTGDYPLAFSEIKRAYLLNQNNLLVKELAQNLGAKHMFHESRYKKQIDSLEHYFEELPFLQENQLFQQQFVYYYMKVISECYMYNEPKEGYSYYNRFLQAIEKYSFKYYSEEHISIGLGSMAYYYAGNDNFSKALQIANKGLELAPESLRLKQVKAEIKDIKQMSKNYNSYNSNVSSQEIVYVNPNKSTSEDLKDKVYEHFPGKWKAVSIIIEDMEQALTKKESFEFDAEKNKDCTYTQNGKTEKGKWAYRMKSKCIYFVPNYDKDKYKVFRVKEVSDDEIIILPYKDQKTPSPYRYVLKPIK